MPKKAPEKIGSVLRVPLFQLHPHPQNPFAVRDDPAMQELKESVSQNGVLVPAIARPRAEGGYELIAGHRRKYACEQAGQEFMPVIVLNLNDDEAVIQLVDSNIQREDILPSERARAYKMKMDAIKRQGARTDLTSPNVSAKFRSDDAVGEKDGISGDTVRNYISLNNLTPPLMQMVDEKIIALTPAYQLAALSEQEQELLVETMSSEQATPSLSQAQRMKKLSQNGKLNEDTMLSIMMEQKKPVREVSLSCLGLRRLAGGNPASEAAFLTQHLCFSPRGLPRFVPNRAGGHGVLSSRLLSRRMYQMNDYEIFKVHAKGASKTPFTYRGENVILLGSF